MLATAHCVTPSPGGSEMLSGTCPRFPVAFPQWWTWVGTCRTPALFLYRSLPAFNRGRRVPSPAGAACRSGRPALPGRDPSWLLQLQRGFHPPPSSPRDHSLREAERERRRRELLGEGTMTNGAARGTGPVLSSSTLQRAHPVFLHKAAQSRRQRPARPGPKFARHYLQLSLPHAPSLPTGRAHPHPPSQRILPPSHPSPPSITTHCR